MQPGIGFLQARSLISVVRRLCPTTATTYSASVDEKFSASAKPMKTTLSQILALCGALAFLPTAHATLNDYDPFEYDGTSLDGQNRQTTWNGAWFTTSGSQPNSLSGDGVSLSYPVPFESPLTTPASAGSRIATGGLSATASTSRKLSQPVDLSVDGTVAYASALFRKNTTNGGVNTDNILIEFVDALGNRRWGFGIEGTGDKPWLNANSSKSAATAVTPGETYLIVTKIVSGATDTAYLKVYGAGYGTQFPAAEPTTWDATNSEVTSAVLDRLRIRIDAGNTAAALGEVDDVRVGTSWQDVAGVVQPPPPDTNPPQVLTADSLLSNIVNVIFSEPVDQATAQNTANYTLDGHTVTAVTLLAETNVQVTFDAPVPDSYTLGIQNVQDLAGNAMIATNVGGILNPGWEASASVLVTNGMAFAMSNKIVMLSDGTDVSGTSDQFQYLYRTVSGDFDLSVRVESLFRTGNNARAGLMARTDTFFDSPNVMIEATPDRFILQYRTNSSEATLAVGSPRPPTAFPNCWIRLARSGTVFTGYSSTNGGVIWDQIASFDTAAGATQPPADLLVGLVASANSTTLTTRAQFSGFGPSMGVVRPKLATALVGSDLELSWNSASIGFELQSTPSLAAPINWTTVPGSTETNRVLIPANNGPLFFRAVHSLP